MARRLMEDAAVKVQWRDFHGFYPEYSGSPLAERPRSLPKAYLQKVYVLFEQAARSRRNNQGNW
jgi:hypothetical protein